MRVVGVVGGRRAVFGPRSSTSKPELDQRALELFLQLEAGVIGGDENFLTHLIKVKSFTAEDAETRRNAEEQPLVVLCDSLRLRVLCGKVFSVFRRHLFGHCGHVRIIDPTAWMRCSARRSAARYVGILSAFAIANTLSIVS